MNKNIKTYIVAGVAGLAFLFLIFPLFYKSELEKRAELVHSMNPQVIEKLNWMTQEYQDLYNADIPDELKQEWLEFYDSLPVSDPDVTADDLFNMMYEYSKRYWPDEE